MGVGVRYTATVPPCHEAEVSDLCLSRLFCVCMRVHMHAHVVCVCVHGIFWT